MRNAPRSSRPTPDASTHASKGPQHDGVSSGAAPPHPIVARLAGARAVDRSGAALMTLAPRDDLAPMAGYHSPQVDVAVRLNTNEAPEPPPAAFTQRLAARLAEVEWHRYPDRSYRALRDAIAKHPGVAPEQVFAANGSNEVLQTLLLTYGGPGRTAAVFEPTYALHSHIARITGTAVAVGEGGGRLPPHIHQGRRG